MIYYEINRLINFALQKNLISKEDKIYSINLILNLLKLKDFKEFKINETLNSATSILENILDYAVDKKLIDNTVVQRDLLDTKIMNCVMPRPSEVIKTFYDKYKTSPSKATDYYYNLSIASNYIRKDRIKKNIAWKTSTIYGELDLTINLSKPEKDPKDIAKAKEEPFTYYPKCLLCKENEGFGGTLNQPARDTHRIVPINLESGQWFLQYSPYTYYNEHCIVLNKAHTPMRISKTTFENLFSFIEKFPHYFLGSNADLPIVGGSILSHAHYQGGFYTFPMERASVEKIYSIKGYEDINIGRVNWPMSTIRLSSFNKEKLSNLASHILDSWRSYSDESVNILNTSNGEIHNTITPIARFRNKMYELDLVLRNNRTSKDYPLGIFHPHKEVHHIKKENIGLIEVMGLAILPGRLKFELEILRKCLLNGVKDISKDEIVLKHSQWYNYLVNKYPCIEESSVDDILRNEVGLKFQEVLSHSGVFKRDKEGLEAFDKFLKEL